MASRRDRALADPDALQTYDITPERLRVTLVVGFGPPAVGKMAVGMELARLTGFGLFHNHMSVDPVVRLIPYDLPRVNGKHADE